MSETALRATPSVNIDEFERRLRATGPLGAVADDPLAELARLLGAEEPPVKPEAAEQAKPEPEPAPAPPPAPVAEAAPAPPPLRAAPRVENAFGRVVNVDFGGGHAAPNPPPPLSVEPPPYVEPAAQSALGAAPARSFGEGAQAPRKIWPIAALIVIGVAGGAGAWAYRGGVPGLTAKAPPLIMAAAGPTKVQPPSQETVSSPNDISSLIGKEEQGKQPTPATVVSHEEQPVDLNERARAQAAADAHAEAPPANAPTIAAAPLVVVAAPPPGAPPAPAPAAANSAAAPSPSSAADTAAMQPTPAAAHGAAEPAPAVASAPSNPPPARAIAPTIASPVAPTDGAAITPGGGTIGPAAAPAPPPAPFPEPKRVKTVSVGPDGSVLAAPQQADQADQPVEPPNLPVNPPTPVPRPAFDASTAEPATPKLDLPTKLSGKTTARVPVPKTDTTAATTGQPPEAPSPAAPEPKPEPKPRKHEPTRVAAAETAPPAAEAAPPQAPAPSQESSGPSSLFDALRGIVHGQDNAAVPPAQAAPVRTASAAATASAPAEGGGFAVQLAAPRTEAEARSVSARLQSKYASELGSLQPVIHAASVKDKTVYRVRVVGLSRAAAVNLCEKLKAAGGACFLARE